MPSLPPPPLCTATHTAAPAGTGNKENNLQASRPTLQSFEAYQALYKEIYGVKADPDFIADQTFTSFFKSDEIFPAHQQKVAAKAEGTGGGASVAKAEGVGGASLSSS